METKEKRVRLRQAEYVTFIYPGSFFAETSRRKVESRDPSAVTDIPEMAYGFFFESRLETETDGKIISGPMENRSGTYYLGGTVLDWRGVVKEIPKNEILLSNMAINGWDRVIKCRFGNVAPFVEGDVVLPYDFEGKEVSHE